MDTDDAQEADQADEPVETTSKGPFGGLSASEAVRRGNALRAERKARAEAEAASDALAIESRSATALGSRLTTAKIGGIVDGLLDDFTAGKGKDRTRIAGELRHWLALAVRLDPQDEAPAGAAWADMSEAQRAAMRARLLQLAIEADAAAAAQSEPQQDSSDPRADGASPAPLDESRP